MYSMFKWTASLAFLAMGFESAIAVERDGVVLEMYQFVEGTISRDGKIHSLQDGMGLTEGDVVDITNAGGATLEFKGCRRSFNYGTKIRLDELFCEGAKFFDACGLSPNDLVEAGDFGRSASIVLAGQDFEYIDEENDVSDGDLIANTYGDVEGVIKRGETGLKLRNQLTLLEGDYVTITKSGGATLEFDGCKRTFEDGHQVLLDEFFCEGAAYLKACAIGNANGSVPPAVMASGAIILGGIAYSVAQDEGASIQPVSP